MQTKKRARSVSFGKKKSEERVSDKVVEEILAKAAASKDEGSNESKGPEGPKEPKETHQEHKSHESKEAEVQVSESVVEVISVSKEPKEESSLEDALKRLREEPAESDSVSESDSVGEVASNAMEKEVTDATSTSNVAKANVVSEKNREGEPKEDNWLESSLKHFRSKEQPEPTPGEEPQREDVISLSNQQKDLSDQKTESYDESKMSDVPASSFFAEAPRRRSSGKKSNNVFYFLSIAFVSFILGLGVMWIFEYGIKNPPSFKFNFNPNWLAFTKPSPTAAPTPTPEPTEEPVDLAAYKIRVLNGSGITGKAAKLKQSLTDAGFTVSSTGNADLDDYTKTQIRAKKDVKSAYLKKLETALKKDYVLDPKPGLAPTGTEDVIVIIGSEEVH